MGAQTLEVSHSRAAELHNQIEALRKAGTWTGIASLAGGFATGAAFPPLAAAIGGVGASAAAAMLYKKISDQRELAQLERRLPRGATAKQS